MTRAALALAVALCAPLARAQSGPPTPDEVPRLDLVRQAQEARAQGDHARAVDLATRAWQLRPTASLQLFIAQEHDHLGRVVEAYANALACERAADVDLALRNRDVVLSTCRALVTATRARVGMVRVALATAPADLTLRVAGSEVAAASRDLPRAVAPGAVEVAVDAPGYLPWRRAVDVAAGAAVDVPVTLVRADAVPVATTRSVGPGPYVLAGVGAASFVAAGVLYGLSLGARDDRDAACARYCLPVSVEHHARYEDFTTATNVALGVGGALVAGGAIWWIVARTRGRAEPARVAPVVTAQGAGLTLGGTL